VSRPLGPYSSLVRAGGLVFTSGQVGVAAFPAGPRLVDGGIVAELTQALANLAAVLAEAGAGLADVVSATVYLADMGDYGAVNEVWAATFGARPPARTTVAVAGLPLQARVEVAAIAYLGETAGS
jgi:2-iminobutanoate/2-iminopropanoate deaminase